MTEFFITARSFAAPFFSDESEGYVEADSPRAALERFASEYRHPAGLYAAEAWADHRHFHKRGSEPLARYLSNHEQALRAATSALSGYSYRGHGPGEFEINGERIHVDDPTAGRVIA